MFVEDDDADSIYGEQLLETVLRRLARVPVPVAPQERDVLASRVV